MQDPWVTTEHTALMYHVGSSENFIKEILTIWNKLLEAVTGEGKRRLAMEFSESHSLNF